MRTTVTLNEQDIADAVRLYLAGQGWRVTGPFTIESTSGDFPGSSAETTATVDVERVPPTAPVPEAEEPAR